jgi:hypothetical protein
MMLDGTGYCECLDQDMDGYDNCNPGNPYDTDGMNADCNDNNPGIHPGSIEYCNGLDDDCDSGTPDGSNDPNIGMACDGQDTDLCMEGTRYCQGGMLMCSDMTGDTPDICNGFDDDCNPATMDGYGDPMVGSPCDGPDSDLCEEGYYVCAGGALMCTDNTGNNMEVCNGLDDDCDGMTDEDACDIYPNMNSVCYGSMGCMYSCLPGYFDCNNNLIDGCETSLYSLPFFYIDYDMDGFGDPNFYTQDCVAPPGYVPVGGDCDDTDANINPGATEICNDLIDNDCDELIDLEDPDCQ